MHTVIAAACDTGNWQQKWDCGWRQPTTGAANAGYFAGHNVVPALVGLMLVVALIIAVSRSRSGRPVTSK